MSRYKSEILIYFLNMLILIIGLILKNEKIIILGQLFSLGNIIYKVRNNQILLLISIFFALYSLPVFCHYYFKINISGYITYNNDEYFYMTLICQTIYLLIFSLVLKNTQPLNSSIVIKIHKYNIPIAYWLCIIGVIITIIIGRSGQNIFSRGGYGAAGEYTGTAIFEYCYIFYILAYVFSGNKRKKEIILKILYVIYIIKGLLFGARIEILAISILVFILFYQNRFKMRTLLIFVVFVYVLFAIFGSFRSSLSFSFNGFSKLYGYNTNSNLIINNETEVFYTSTVILASLKTGFINLSYRITALINYIIRLLLPSSMVSGIYNVVPYLQRNFSNCGGGGFFSSFLYFYGGWIGVLVGAILSASIWNKMKSINNQTVKWQLFIIISIVMTPRWYAYSPEAIVKIPLYTVIVFFVMLSFFKVKTNYKKINE